MSGGRAFTPRASDAPHRIWGDGLEPDAVQQLKNACKLPVAVAGALMPDAHVGYGLPIGGVLATRNAVIPYAVGVDIACRMKMTVLDLPVDTLARGAGSARERHRARDPVRHRRDIQGAPTARRHGRRLERVERDRGAEGSRVVAAGHERQRQSLRRVRAPRRTRCGHRPAAGRVSRAAQPLGQPRHGRTGRAALQSAGAFAAPGAAAGARASRVARPVVGRRPGVLGSDGTHGSLRGGEPRADPRAHRAGTRRRGVARPREPPQLRVARTTSTRRWHRGRRDRAPQGRHACRRRRARHHPRVDGDARLRRARQGIRGVAQLSGARRRTQDEPDESEAARSRGTPRCVSCASAA